MRLIKNIRRRLGTASARGVLVTTLITYLGMALSLASAPLLAHALGADGRGVVAGSFALVQTLAWVGFLSLPRVLARDSVNDCTVPRGSTLILTGLGVVNAVAVLFLADVLSNGDARIALGMRVAALVLVFNGVAQVGIEYTLARGMMGMFNASRVGYTILPSLAIILLALTEHLTIASAFIATLSGQVVTVLVGLILLTRTIPDRSRTAIPWRSSIQLWSTSAIDSASGQLGQILLAAVSTASQVGIYSIAIMLGSAAAAISQAAMQMSYSHFIRQAKNAQSQSARTMRLTTWLGILSTLVVGAALLFIVHLWGTALFGPTFAGLELVTAAALVSQISTDQWNLRVLHDTAHAQVARLIAASCTGASVTIMTAVVLGANSALNATSMALALAGGTITKLSLRALIVHRLGRNI